MCTLTRSQHRLCLRQVLTFLTVPSQNLGETSHRLTVDFFRSLFRCEDHRLEKITMAMASGFQSFRSSGLGSSPTGWSSHAQVCAHSLSSRAQKKPRRRPTAVVSAHPPVAPNSREKVPFQDNQVQLHMLYLSAAASASARSLDISKTITAIPRSLASLSPEVVFYRWGKKKATKARKHGCSI